MKGDVTYTFTLDPKLLDMLKEKAYLQRQTVSGLLRVMIAREVAKAPKVQR